MLKGIILIFFIQYFGNIHSKEQRLKQPSEKEGNNNSLEIKNIPNIIFGMYV